MHKYIISCQSEGLWLWFVDNELQQMVAILLQ